ncbi:MAG: hypothetical protein ABJE95_00735 [Byssovorax sp.]
MNSSDERNALCAKVAKLEDDLARTAATITDLRGQHRVRRLRFAGRAAVAAIGVVALLGVAGIR